MRGLGACNSSKRARHLPFNPPPNYAGEWPPKHWPNNHMKFQENDHIAVHSQPVWRDRTDFIFHAYCGSKNGRNEWEQLWGKKVAPSCYVVCCIPFFVYDVALGDEVEIDTNHVLKRVVNKSGQLTFRVWFGEQGAAIRKKMVLEMETMDLLMEWSSYNLLGLSVQQDRAQLLADYLQLRENEGLLKYETGQS